MLAVRYMHACRSVSSSSCMYTPRESWEPLWWDNSFSIFSMACSGPGHCSCGWCLCYFAYLSRENAQVKEKLQVLTSPSAILVFCTACTGFQNVCFNGCGSRMLVTWLFPAELVLRSSPGTRHRSAQLGQPRPATCCPVTPSSPALPCLKETGWANLLYLFCS